MAAPNHARLQVIATLWTIAENLEAQGQQSKSAEIASLATALHELDEGKVDPILEPTKIDNRAADPHRVWRARIVAVGAFELLQLGAFGRKEAAAEVVKIIPNFRVLRTGRMTGTDQAALQSWVNRLRQARELPAEIADLYRTQRETIRSSGTIPKDRALQAARRLIELAPQSGVVFPAS